MLGKTLNHYEIGERLGAGGMGAVYRGKDRKLGRDVAIKVLPEEFAKDADRVARFQREAKLLASLNHPNIAAIYGLEECNGINFLVLELVEGETLSDRIKQGPIPVEESLKLAFQIAEALEAAHEMGVIHRDLKPANIKVTPEGKVKILDFGLAKAFAGGQAEMLLSNSPTLSAAATQQGMILGTAAYMSPEQARGKSVDKRADIWAFGLILLEMLTGKKMFAGEVISDTLASVLKDEPDFAKVPANIRLLLHSCLEKDPSKRLRDIGDAWRLMGVAPVIESETLSRKRSWSAWTVAVLSLVGLIAVSAFYLFQAPVENPGMYLEANTAATSEPYSLAISPDGRLLVYVAEAEGRQRLWLKHFDRASAQPLPGTEGANFPFWSPNSQSIGFFAGGKLKRVKIEGGMPEPLADAPAGLGGTWNRDNVIVFTPNMGRPLYRVPATGGDAVAVTRLNPPNQTSHNFPHFLPDDRRLLYYSWGAEPGIHLASLDSDETMPLFHADSPATYASTGHLLFLRRSTLFAQPFDPDTGKTAGSPVQIAESIAQHPAFNYGGFSVSNNGRLVYRTISGTARRQLVWINRSGKEIGTLGEAMENILNPEISPDDGHVAVDQIIPSMDGGALVWLIEAARGVARKFTNEIEWQIFSVWSPDSSQIVFSTYREGAWDLHRMPSNGSGKPEILMESLDPGIIRFAYDWSRDGRYLLYLPVDPKTGRDLWVMGMSGNERKPFPFVHTSFEEQNGQFSPDTRWIAYQSNESGRFEIFIQAFPGPGAKVPVSTGGGIQPRWHPEGRELFYIAPDGMLMAAPIQQDGQSVKAGVPISLFPARIPRGGYLDIMRMQYDISRDGRHFLMNVNVDNPQPSPITIVTNWTHALNK